MLITGNNPMIQGLKVLNRGGSKTKGRWNLLNPSYLLLLLKSFEDSNRDFDLSSKLARSQHEPRDARIGVGLAKDEIKHHIQRYTIRKVSS